MENAAGLPADKLRNSEIDLSKNQYLSVNSNYGFLCQTISVINGFFLYLFITPYSFYSALLNIHVQTDYLCSLCVDSFD